MFHLNTRSRCILQKWNYDGFITFTTFTMKLQIYLLQVFPASVVLNKINFPFEYFPWFKWLCTIRDLNTAIWEALCYNTLKDPIYEYIYIR